MGRLSGIIRTTDALLTRERAMRWGMAFACAWLGVLVVDAVLHMTHGITNAKGEHLARDFINYWSGAKLAFAGKAAQIYDINAFADFQKSLAGPQSEIKIFSYPPVTLLLAAPLALLPFIPALLAWQAAGLGACYALLRRLATDSRTALACLVAPPVFLINVMSGQNGHFTMALMCGGLWMLDKRPAVAGVMLGALAYKPQLGILLPVALLAGRQWSAFFAAAATVVLLVGGSVVAFGPEIWLAFLQQGKVQRLLMEEGTTFWHRMATVFAAVRALGLGTYAAYAAQATSAALAAGCVFILWRGNAKPACRAAGLVLATFLATPYAWDYDMVVLAAVMLWLVSEAEGTYVSGEKTGWAALMILPFIMMLLTKGAHINLAPVVLWWALANVMLRYKSLQPQGKP